MTDEQRDISAYPGPLVVTMPEVVDSDNADRVAAKLHLHSPPGTPRSSPT